MNNWTSFDLLVHRFFQCKYPAKLKHKGRKVQRLKKWYQVKHLSKKLGVKII